MLVPQTLRSGIVTPSLIAIRAISHTLLQMNTPQLFDLVVTKKVTGTMADVNKQFSFTIHLTNSNGEIDTRNYPYQVWSMGADETKGGTDDTKVTTNGKSGTLTDNNTFTLKHNEYNSVVADYPTEKV